MLRIMISYSRSDAEQAQRIVRKLEKIEFDVWIDTEDIPPSIEWEEEIKRNILRADSVILLLSETSSKSKYVQMEIDYALEVGKHILVVKIQKDIEEIPSKWGALQHIDYIEIEEKGISEISSALSDRTKYHRIKMAWRRVLRDISLTMPTLAEFYQTIIPLYVYGSKLAVQTPTQSIFKEKEVEVCSLIAHSLHTIGFEEFEVVLYVLP